jgi:YVTN family beta-propeller protein
MRRFRSARWRHDHRRTLRKTIGGGLAVALLGGFAAIAGASGITSGFGDAQVGTANADGILLPTNQRIDPIGKRILDTSGRLLSSSISPNGKYLAALSWNEFTGYLTIFNLQTGKIIEQLGDAYPNPGIGDGTVAADGPLWSANGRSLWFPQTADLVHFPVSTAGIASKGVVIPLEETIDNLTTGPTTVPDLPSGMALSSDGTKLYVALNGVNQLGVINTATNQLEKVVPVGNAPRQVVVIGGNAFVSNEGGRKATQGEYTNNSDGTNIVANKVTGAASTGTVTEVNLGSEKPVKQISVGLEPTAEYVAPDGTLMVANSNDDTFSLIDPKSAAVVQTVNVNPLPGSTVGSYPNAITMPNASTILVSIGRDNAVAVYGYSGPTMPVKYEGLLPTDFYPVDVTMDRALGSHGEIVVTNDKGIGSRGPDSTIDKGPGTSPGAEDATGHNTYDDTGSITTFAMPSMSAIGTYTAQVFRNNDWDHLLASKPIENSKAAPVAIPVHLGDPSKIKHVFLIVKENRTYDQILGDIGKGNSDPKLAQFGKKVTPNAHALADDFGLFDNFYDEGTLSADGHNWLMQADANDYIEKEFGAFYRSYPAQGGDALAYQRDGFLWNAVEAAGKTVKDFGEYNNFQTDSPTATWSDYFKDSQIMQGKAKGPLPVAPSAVHSYADIPSLNAIDDHEFPVFDLNIPDQYRVDIWQKSFEKDEKSGQLPNLEMMWVMDDHTAGVGTGDPAPVAEVADNDLAVGRIVSDISHSKFWSSSAVFVVEDDSQNGTDHVDGHRSPLLIASPYAKRGIVDNTYYTQLNLVKTIEQILGAAPMNQEDRAATPMFNAFTNTPNDTPYNVVPNQTSLTYGLTLSSSAKRTSAASGDTPDLVPASAAQLHIPVSERTIYEDWVVWSRTGRFNGQHAIQDWANPAQLNRLDWYSAHDWKVPYPGDKAILAPDQVPGHQLPADYLGD